MFKKSEKNKKVIKDYYSNFKQMDDNIKNFK